MMWLNCDRGPNRFKQRFKRLPKQWDIDGLHELHGRLEKRSNERQKTLWDYISHLKTIIPREKNKEHIVYFKQNGIVRSFVLKDYDGYSEKDLNLTNRDGKMSLVLATDDMLKLGNKMKKLIKLADSPFKWKVFDRLNKKIESKLLNDLGPNRYDPEKIYIIDIQGIKYIYHMTRGILETIIEEKIIKL